MFMTRWSLIGSLVLGTFALPALAGCGTTAAAPPVTAHTPSPHVKHPARKTASGTRSRHASRRSHAGTAPSSISPSVTPLSSSGSAASAVFGSAAWSEALQAQLAQQLHRATVNPLDIFPTSPDWNLPAHSVLIVEPLAYQNTFYYAVAQKGQPVVWKHFSNSVTTISSAVAAQVPEPLFWAMHFAMQMIQGVQAAPTLGNTIPWNTVAGNVGNPVAVAGYYMPPMYGDPANLSIAVFLPMAWKNPQDAGEALYSLPDGHLVSFSVHAYVNSNTWHISQSFSAIPPSQLDQQLPTTAQQGDFLLPHRL